MAHIATGAEAGNSYELASLGNMAYENVVANAHTGDKTVVATMDDGQNGQVYFYFGDKQATGNAIDKAGLTGGHSVGLHGQRARTWPTTTTEAPLARLAATIKSTFSLVDLGDVSGKTGAQIDAASETAGVTSFLRPEDGAWDTINPNRFYFVTTNAFNAPSQLWAVDFNDASQSGCRRYHQAAAQRHRRSADVRQHHRRCARQDRPAEDVGNNAHLGKLWQYDPATDALTQIAQHDPARFLDGRQHNFLTQDEEASGVIDVSTSSAMPARTSIWITQVHCTVGGETVEGGQLMLIHQYHA